MDKEITLGERIYQYRSARGLSQLELSELLDVSRQSISKWETDVAVPELSKLVKMAEIFEISLDALVLGKENEAKEESINEEPAPAPTIAEIREKSRIKTGFGFCFLGVGILLSFLILLLAGDLISALIIFVPFGISAFFCLKQFRHAALWCVEGWYLCIVTYFFYATGLSWNSWFSILITSFSASVQENPLSIIISLVFFVILVLLISLTVFVHRNESFDCSIRKSKALAVITFAIFPVKFLVFELPIQIWSIVDMQGVVSLISKHSALFRAVTYLANLAALITFTACLVPTFYWIVGCIKKKRNV